jgi:hypothetical protein
MPKYIPEPEKETLATEVLAADAPLSFPEWLYRQILDTGRSGKRNWHCPFCQIRKFPVSPKDYAQLKYKLKKAPFVVDKPPVYSEPPPIDFKWPKIRWHCYRCDRWGDEFDLVRRLGLSLNSYYSARDFLKPYVETYISMRTTSPLGDPYDAWGLYEVEMLRSLYSPRGDVKQREAWFAKRVAKQRSQRAWRSNKT